MSCEFGGYVAFRIICFCNEALLLFILYCLIFCIYNIKYVEYFIEYTLFVLTGVWQYIFSIWRASELIFNVVE